MPAPTLVRLQAAREVLHEKLERGDVGLGDVGVILYNQEIIMEALELLLVSQRRAALGLPAGDRA